MEVYLQLKWSGEVLAMLKRGGAQQICELEGLAILKGEAQRVKDRHG